VAILTGVRVGGLLGVVVAVPMAVLLKEALANLRAQDPTPGAVKSLPEVEPESPSVGIAAAAPSPVAECD
jgi:predicted PurR-regulated permease PerM